LNIRIVRPLKGGSIAAIASKSAAHRLLICASLADSKTFVRCTERSQDIDATAKCVKSLGAGIRYKGSGFYITPVKKPKDLLKERSIDCGESGSTLRFLLPVCGALGMTVKFNMEGRLPARPLTGLFEEMTAHGCTLSEQGRSSLSCGGKLTSGVYSIPGNVSSQFISGLLFALPLLEGDSTIRVTEDLESRPYVDMTLDSLRFFGIKIHEEEIPVLTFRVPGNQTYVSPKTVHTEGDWSNAAFWLCAGAIGTSGITCTGLNVDSKQGDRVIIELLRKFGARVSDYNGTVTVSPGPLEGIEINAKDTPDLVPVLAAVASTALGKTIIRGAGRLRLKESDRLHTIAASLSALGADIKETDDGLIIHGKVRMAGGVTQSFGDHRIAMAAAVLSGACGGAVTIKNAETVKKSYPAFFDDFHKAFGGICEKE
jgi:3-phosphoshikimate 1-carboxyvinyltransferase